VIVKLGINCEWTSCGVSMLRSLRRLQGPRCGPLSRWWNCSRNAEFACQGFNNSANLSSVLAWRTASRGLVTGAFQPSPSTIQATGTVRLKDLPAIYKQLSKFRLSFLVMTTATAGFIAGESLQVPSNTATKPVQQTTSLTNALKNAFVIKLEWCIRGLNWLGCLFKQCLVY
jgi:hypothetical protein